MQKFDVIVIGGGPAGASAALYLARGGRATCVIHNGASALLKTNTIQNFYGAGTVSGKELYERGLRQAAEVGAVIVGGEVTHVEATGGFTVETESAVYTASRLVIATGADRLSLDIPGLKEFEGRGVSYCAVCDAFFYRKKKVAVVGAGEYARREYDTLKAVAASVALFTDGEKASFSVPDTVTSKLVGLYKNADGTRLGGAEFADGTRRDIDGLFIAKGVLGGTGLCKSLGVFTDDRGGIIVDGRGMTNIPGLYAAGDCTSGVKQIARAAADGMNVALNIMGDRV